MIVIPGQGNVKPHHQYALNAMFDPSATGYGHSKTFRDERSVLKKDGLSVPTQPQVQILGQGNWKDVDGLAEINLKHPTHDSFHKDILSQEAIDSGETRFYRWHIDSALYELSPPKVTTLQCIYTPEGDDQYVTLPDGRLDVPLGTTAFISGANAFDRLSEEEKEFVLNTSAIYAPHPYIFISPAKATSDGLTMVSEGKETNLESLPEWEASKVKTLPLVWTNEITGRHHFQVHGCCIHKLVTTKPDGTKVFVDDLAEVREKVHSMMKKSFNRDDIFCHRWTEGDMVIFDNRGVWHSVVGQFGPGQKRLMHQCNLASAEDPKTIAR